MTQTLAERGITIETGAKVRIWGGWYRHDTVRKDGVVIGRIQTKRQNRRTNCITLDTGNACVLGCHIDWLERQAPAV